MADIESNINLDIDASGAIASLKELQRQISVFQTTMAKTGAVSNARLSDMQHNLVNSINATGQFTASIQRVKTTTESFTQALEKNKLSMGQYFRYSMGATKTFGKGFKTEFDTIEKVARERVKTLQTQYIKLGRDASGAMQAIAVRPQVLDMKDLGTQTAIAAQKAQLFNQLMQQGSTNLLNFGKNTQWAGRQLMVGFTIPLGIMGAAAAKEFQKIEEQVIRLERVYGDFTTTMADTEQITQQIKDLGSEFTKYGVAVSKTIGLAADAAAMGKTGADLVAQVAEANRLAVLGGVDQQQSLETTISLTNSFGIAAEQLSGKINFLNAVENQTVTSIQDLTEAIPKAGPVVQQLGGNVEDLTFFLTAMKEGGINASEGANALKSGLASLINPTGEAVDMLAGFGINLQGIVEANKGNVKGIVIDFARALDTLDPLNRAQAIEQLFGKFQFSRLSTLFQNVIAEGSQASRVLDLTKASAAELASLSERELGRIEASPLFKYQAAIENFKAALAPVGEEFMKAVTPLINFGTDLLKAFNDLEGGAKQFAVIATGAIGAIGPILLMTFGLLANGLANIVKGVLFMRNGFKGAGVQSNILTEQLSYMNTEQLEAAAISASLNQVHNNLIQTFTSEAGAVRNLAAAYAQAVSVQGAFAGPIMTGAGLRTPKKFAEGGIIQGPGTGTSDSIPAMLSNGEAVISAATVKKYPGLVNGLIAGKVGHFATAGVVGRNTTPLAPNIAFHGSTKMVDVEKLLTALSSGTSGITNASAVLEETLLRLSGKTAVSFKELAREVMTVSKALNGEAVAIGTINGILGKEVLKYKSVGQAPIASLATDPSMSDEYARARAARTAVLADKEARGIAPKPTDAQLVRAHSSVVPGNMKQIAEGWARPLWVLQIEEENQLSNLLAGSTKVQALADDYMRLLAQSSATEQEKASIIHKINNNLALSDRELMIQRDILMQMQTSSAATLAAKPGAAEVIRGTIVAANAREQFGITATSGSRDPIAADAALAIARQQLNANNPEGVGKGTFVPRSEVGQRLVTEVAKSIDDASGASSPARRFITASGKHIVDGAIIPIEQAGPRAKKAGEEVIGAVAAGAQKAAATIPKIDPRVKHLQDKFPKIVGSVPNLLDAQLAQSGGMNILKGKELQFERGKRLLGASQMLKPMNMLDSITGKLSNTARAASDNFAVLKAKTQLAAQIVKTDLQTSLTKLGTAAQTVASKIKTGTAQMLSSMPGRMAGAGQKVKGFVAANQGKFAGAGMAASVGLMFASGQEGPVGEIAGKIAGPLMAISSISTTIGMMGPVLGTVVAGLAAVAGGFIAYNIAMDNARKSGQELSDAMSMTTEKLNGLSEITGQQSLSALEAMKREQSVANIKAGFSKEQSSEMNMFKDQFSGSEIGKQFLKDVKTQLANGSSISDVARNMSLQLSSAIADGVMSKDQADAIAETLAKSIKSKKFEIELKGNLSEIVGINGENLVNNPGAVANTLTAKSNQQAISAGTYAVQKEQEFTGSEQIATVGQIAAAGGAAVAAGGVAAGMLATSGTLLGVTAGSAATGVGAPIATITGVTALVLGLTAAIWGSVEANIQNAKNAQLAASQYNEAYIQNLKMVDAINARYDTLISEKQAQLSLATTEEERLRLNQEISALQATQTNALDRQRQAQTQLIANAVKTKEGLGETTWDDAQKKQIETTYKDDVAMQELAKKQYDRASNESVIGDKTTQATLEVQIASGAIDPRTSEILLNALSGNADLQANYNLLMTQEGDATTIQMVNSLVATGASEEVIEKHINLVATGQEDAQELIELTGIAAELQASGISINIDADADMDKLKEIKAGIAEVETMFANGPVTGQVISDFLYRSTGFDLSEEQQAYFNSLPPEAQKQFTTAYLTVIETIDTNTEAGRARLREWAASKGEKGKSSKYYDKGNKIKGAKYDYNAIAKDMQAEAYTNAQASAAQVQASIAPPPSGPPSNTPSGGGGGGGGSQEPEKPPTSFLDSLVKDIRDFTNATQGLTEDFQSSMSAIRSASASAFSGLSQQLRGVGIGEDVISLMTGMSKEEWDQYKGQFFNFDAAGNVTGFKADLTAIADKLRTITLGKFVDDQQKSLANLAAQNTALTKLVSLGMTYANAYKLIEDAAFAAAIANAKSAEEIRQIIALAEQARKAQSLTDASKGVANANDTTDATVAGLNALIRFNSALTDTQTAAILADDNLQTMLANFDTLSIDQLKVLNEALQDAADKEALEIKIKMQTKEGMQDLFNEGLNKAMEQFSAREQEIKIKFKALKDPFQDIIDSFTQQVEDMRNQPGGLDDLEADLQRIGEQEIDINKKYDERYKALDSIAKINERVAAQQRTQLSLAEALSMGDIAAAARAAEEMRAQDAAQALVDQREALQKSQELEIENLTANMGLTREQLEARIRNIKREIFEIEEKQIEPAQYQLELLGRQEEAQIGALTVAGKTKEEWETIKNNIDLARTNSQQYNEAVNLALGVVQELENAWKEIEKPKQTIHTIIEKRISEAEAAAAAKPAAPVASTQPAPAAPADYHTEAYRNDMARRVIRGEFGNGQARRNALGADYQWIQDRVNDMVYHRNGYANGGLVASYFANGGMTKPMFAQKGTDTVPAMLTPGEFVVKKWAVDRFGVGNLNAINQGNFGSGSVYNYNMSVNVRSDANPDEIARTVMAQIKRVDAQRIRGNRF